MRSFIWTPSIPMVETLPARTRSPRARQCASSDGLENALRRQGAAPDEFYLRAQASSKVVRFRRLPMAGDLSGKAFARFRNTPI